MTAVNTIPIKITTEATEYVAELGMQKEFEQLLEHTQQTIPELRSVQVIPLAGENDGSPQRQQGSLPRARRPLLALRAPVRTTRQLYTLQPANDAEYPSILFEAVGGSAETNHTLIEMDWCRWKAEHFSPEVFLRFSLLSVSE